MISRRSSSIPASLRGAQRGGDLRLGDPVQAQHVAAVLDRAGQRRPQRRAADHGRVPHRLQLARRAGQDDDGRGGLARRRRGHHEPGGGADRLEDLGAVGDHRLLAVGLEHRRRIEIRPARHERAQDLGDAALQRLVEHHRAALELADHGGGQVVGGRSQAAARADQRTALAGEEAQCAQDVGGPVADHRGGDRVGAELQQALGQPRAVAVQDAPGEHLGAGHDDARADAHARGLTARRRAVAWPTAAGARAPG